MTRRTRGGLFRWLGMALSAGMFGLAAFSGGVGAGAAVVAYLERTGTLPPPAWIAAQRTTARVAIPEPRLPYEEPMDQAAAAPPQLPASPPAPPDPVVPTAADGREIAPAQSAEGPEPVAETPVIPAWMLAAVPIDVPQDRPMVAIIFDDLAVDQARSRRAIDLPGPLTMSFLPYGRNLDDLTDAARDRGHEIMVHLPMEPKDPAYPPT